VTSGEEYVPSVSMEEREIQVLASALETAADAATIREEDAADEVVTEDDQSESPAHSLSTFSAGSARSSENGSGTGASNGVGVQRLLDSSNPDEGSEEANARKAEAERAHIYENALETFENQNPSVTNESQNGKTTGMLKILLGYLQVIMLLQNSLPSVPWPNQMQAAQGYGSFVMLDISQFLPMGCFFGDDFFSSVYARLILAALSPPIFGVLVYIPTRWLAEKKKKDYLEAEMLNRVATARIAKDVYEAAVDKSVHGPLMVMFLMYPIVSIRILSVFNCRYIEDAWFLVDDVTAECYNGTWGIFSTIGVFMTLLYPIGVPLIMYILLNRNQHKLHKPKIFNRLGFLYQNYRHETYYGDVLDAVRKLMVTSVVMFFRPGTNMQVGGTMLISFCFLLWNVKVQPYKDPAINQLQTFNLAGVSLVLFLGLMLKGYKCEPDEVIPGDWEITIIQGILIAVNLFIVANMAYRSMIPMYRTAYNEYQAESQIKEQTKKRLNALENASLVLAANTYDDIQEAPKVKQKVEEEKIPEITSGVDVVAVFAEMDIARVMDSILDTDEVRGIAQQGRIRGEFYTDTERAALLSSVQTCLVWFLDRFEHERETLLRTKSLTPLDAEWPPKTINGLRKSKEVVNLAFESAGLASLGESVEKLSLEIMGDCVQKKFPDYCPQVVQMKNHLRKAAKAIALAVTGNGLSKFRNQIENIHDEAKDSIHEAMEPVFFAAAREIFDRVSADGETLCTGEELRNVITGLVFKFGEFLSTPPCEVEIVSAAAQHAEETPMPFVEFLGFFNHHYRGKENTQMATFGCTAVDRDNLGTRSSQWSSHDAMTTSEPRSTREALSTNSKSGSSGGKSKILAARQKLAAAMHKKDKPESDNGSETDTQTKHSEEPTKEAKQAPKKSKAAQMLAERRKQRAQEASNKGDGPQQ